MRLVLFASGLPVPACSTSPPPSVVAGPSGDTVWEGCHGLDVGRKAPSPVVRRLLSGTYFAVGADGRAQELPGAAPPVHSQHPKDLQEAQAPQGRGQDVALVSHGNHWH